MQLMQASLTHCCSRTAVHRPVQQQGTCRQLLVATRPFSTSWASSKRQQLVLARAETESQEPATSQPATSSKPEDEPVWIRRERERELQAKEGKDLPFGLYLLFSAFVAIAAVGSIFEYTNQNAIFDVIPPSNPLWAPILGLFVFTGFPMAGFLFYKAVASANKASEQMDKLDGY